MVMEKKDRDEDCVEPINTVIFDLDGTLLDTLEDLWYAVNESLRKFGFPERTLEEIRHFVGNGIHVLVELAVPEGTSPEKTEEVFLFFQEYYTQHCRIRTAPYDGVVNLLGELKRKGFRTAIVSNKNQEAAVRLCDIYFPSVSVVAGQIKGRRKKPAADAILYAMEKLGSNQTHTIYVGDSEIDYQTAKNTKIPCVLVTWGFRDKEELIPLHPWGMIDSPEDLWRYLPAGNRNDLTKRPDHGETFACESREDFCL